MRRPSCVWLFSVSKSVFIWFERGEPVISMLEFVSRRGSFSS